MSSTDADAKRLRRYYETSIVAAARELERDGVTLFPLRADPAVTSYFETRMDRSDYVEEATFDVVERLAERWKRDEHPALARAALALVELRQSLSIEAAVSQDVPAFVYAMF
jgi:hypothetical protein